MSSLGDQHEMYGRRTKGVLHLPLEHKVFVEDLGFWAADFGQERHPCAHQTMAPASISSIPKPGSRVL